MSRTPHIGANGATLTLAFYHADADGNIPKMLNTSQTVFILGRRMETTDFADDTDPQKLGSLEGRPSSR